jgi:hypothetical protein
MNHYFTLKDDFIMESHVNKRQSYYEWRRTPWFSIPIALVARKYQEVRSRQPVQLFTCDICSVFGAER